MFGLGFGEILVILVVALLVFGPERLPEIARTLGKTMAEFRRAMDEMRYEFNSSRLDLEHPRPVPPQSQPAQSQPTSTAQPVIDQTPVVSVAEPAALSVAEPTTLSVAEPTAPIADLATPASDLAAAQLAKEEGPKHYSTTHSTPPHHGVADEPGRKAYSETSGAGAPAEPAAEHPKDPSENGPGHQ